MATLEAAARIRETTRRMTMIVDVKGLRVSSLRFWLAKPFMRLGCWIAGIGGVRFEGE